MDPSVRILLSEVERRDTVRRTFFDKQLEIWRARRRNPMPTAVRCPRRTGKSVLAAGLQIDDALRHPHSHYPYIALTGPSARQLAWPIFARIQREHPELGLQLHDGDLTWWLPNGANGKLWGADRDDLHRNLYGGKNRIPVLDECAYWKTDLGAFYRDVLEPTVADERGYCLLVGAPGPVLKGYFFDITRMERDLRLPGWDVYEWGVPDNPHVAEQFHELCARWASVDPHYAEKPWFRRQWLGHWIAESADNVYVYERARNTSYDARPVEPSDEFVLAMDTGYSAGMAFVVMRWNQERSPRATVLSSRWKAEMLTDAIAAEINRYRDLYRRLTIVGDPNNAQLLADLNVRYRIPVLKAEKTDKRSWQRIVNTAFMTLMLEVLDPEGANADLVLELEALKRRYLPGTTVTILEDGSRRIEGAGEWEEDPTSSTNHCCDALLYGYRYCHTYLYIPPTKRPDPGTREWAAEEARKMREERLRAVREAEREMDASAS